jgi:hypothetical protein
LSYLLRIWQEDDETAVWRASLQSPQSGERMGFASLERLFDFLQGETRAAQDSEEARHVGKERGGDRDKSTGGEN